MSRRSASPEAETRSYCPPPPLAIKVTISSLDPAYLALTWQPVCCSNGFTQAGWAYPSHAMRLSCPSVFPVEPAGFIPAVGGCPAPPLDDEAGVLEPPQPASRRPATQPITTAITILGCLRIMCPFRCRHHRAPCRLPESGMSGPRAMTGEPAPPRRP